MLEVGVCCFIKNYRIVSRIYCFQLNLLLTAIENNCTGFSWGDVLVEVKLAFIDFFNKKFLHFYCTQMFKLFFERCPPPFSSFPFGYWRRLNIHFFLNMKQCLQCIKTKNGRSEIQRYREEERWWRAPALLLIYWLMTCVRTLVRKSLLPAH